MIIIETKILRLMYGHIKIDKIKNWEYYSKNWDNTYWEKKLKEIY